MALIQTERITSTRNGGGYTISKNINRRRINNNMIKQEMLLHQKGWNRYFDSRVMSKLCLCIKWLLRYCWILDWIWLLGIKAHHLLSSRKVIISLVVSETSASKLRVVKLCSGCGPYQKIIKIIRQCVCAQNGGYAKPESNRDTNKTTQI